MTTGQYVFGGYVKRLQTLFQQRKVNVSYRETVRLITRNPAHLTLVFYPDSMRELSIGCIGTRVRCTWSLSDVSM